MEQEKKAEKAALLQRNKAFAEVIWREEEEWEEEEEISSFILCIDTLPWLSNLMVEVE